MENREPTYPGRVKLTPVPGQENIYDMERADEPTVEGTPLNKSTLLQDATCAILNIPDTSVPNDAFVKLALGIGKYGYVIHVQYPDGSPAEGFTLTGLSAPDGAPAVTNENGDAVGVSTEQSVTIGLNSPYIDIQDVSGQVVVSSGILTHHTITLSFSSSEYETITQSQSIYFSPFVISYDLTAVGGGGGGMKWDREDSGGNGGGGGYVSTLLNVNNDGPISVSIGAGGEPDNVHSGASQAGKGGTTIVSKKTTEETILTALGGDGGTSGAVGGTGNGNGGRNYYRQDDSVTNGGDSTDRIFNDSSLPLAGGGGGGGYHAGGDTGAKGGAPYGANGDKNIYGNVTHSTGPTGPGGGGGGILGSNDSYDGAGNNGAVYIRWHYSA